MSKLICSIMCLTYAWIYRAKKVEKALRKCPKTKVVMGGWSQGAQVVHKAAGLVDKAKDAKGISLMKSVGAVVTFGDPMGKGWCYTYRPRLNSCKDGLSRQSRSVACASD